MQVFSVVNIKLTALTWNLFWKLWWM